MNTERLHAFLLQLQSELQATSLPTSLTELSQALSELTEATDAAEQNEAQKNVADAKRNLIAAVQNSTVESFSSVDMELLESLGIRQYVGKPLGQYIENTLNKNGLTLPDAVNDVNEALTKVTSTYDAIRQTLAGFEVLGIEYEYLEAGECEVALFVPPEGIERSLIELSKELKHLDIVLAAACEIATGRRDAYSVASLSSSDFGIFSDIPLEAGALLVAVTSQLISAYRNVLEIKKGRESMSERGVPDEALASIDEHANSVMENEVETVVESIAEKYLSNVDSHRSNELKIQLKKSCQFLGDRIDKGYHLEVRVGPAPEQDDTSSSEGEDDNGNETLTTVHAAILKQQRELEFKAPPGKPTLHLFNDDDEHSASDDV